ncbi:MAG: two-component system response regulator [Betaproteobacteria bacterium HGW-Betaproteobacteria-12]|nr:MAG: two-component system response regulator [Betaproteobacteria bacterium HGW-Betaproteobacteria-12]
MSEARPLTLLFVDDEPSILSALRRLFRPHGYRILIAESGQAGLDTLASETVDLVISDMRMPEMDGATFLKAVRQKWPGIIRILLTGYADITSTIAAINEGEIYRYIAKPWDDNEIVLVVREALERQRLEAENQRLTELTQQQNDELKALNAGLEQKVAERTAEVRGALGELRKTFMATVQVCAGMVELRAGQAGAQLAGHGRRVAEHARATARRLQLSDNEVQTIMLAGLLHDIGKIGLADELLVRPFNLLTPDHRAQVMKHAVLGQNILMPIEKLRDSALLIRHHHENYDGSGFPDRLAGMAIPIGSRILAVVNDYDALQIGTLAQRPQKPADALTFLLDNRGRRYDPRVVDAFAALLAETQKPPPGEQTLRPLQLKPGQILARELNHSEGFMLLAQGSRLTPEIIQQLIKLEESEQRTYTVHIRQEEKS